MNREQGLCRVIVDVSGSTSKWVFDKLDMDITNVDEIFSLAFYINGVLIGGLVYHDYRESHDVWWTIYTTSKKWCNKRILKQIFSLAFGYLKCNRINILVDTDNKKSLRLVNGLGFKIEGTLREFRENGKDCYFLGILKRHNKWS